MPQETSKGHQHTEGAAIGSEMPSDSTRKAEAPSLGGANHNKHSRRTRDREPEAGQVDPAKVSAVL